MIAIGWSFFITSTVIGASMSISNMENKSANPDNLASSTNSSIAKSGQALFAMGCFWCGEAEFRNHATNELLPGVTALTVGYAGGTTPNPTYEAHEGYREAVKLAFDPDVITYSQLLDIFWKNIDPLDGSGQFCDIGFSYSAAIFYFDEQQKAIAQQKKQELETKFKVKVETDILPVTTFYQAEDYHQNYKAKNPISYKFYRWRCGRDQRLQELSELGEPGVAGKPNE